VTGLAAFTGCASNTATQGSCNGGKCDGFDADKLASRNDPIAAYLKNLSISDTGLLELTYQDVLFGVGEGMGCAPDAAGVFTVSDDLISGEAFPRLVSVACKDDDSKASDFFIAASFRDQETGDVDVRDVEMFAWDRTARNYMFYAFAPSQDDPDLVQLEVGPSRCEGCHLTPADTSPVGMRMTPIMNELSRPWAHWNAQPGFPSLEFSVPEGIEDLPNYSGLAIAHQAPASRFEEIVRFGGHQKVAAARIRDRRNSPNISEIMGMLRPVFCSEQINYVSEDHDSGVLFNAALVDPGVRNMYVQIRPNDWAWDWLNDETVRLGTAGGDEPVIQIPTRGNADIAMEASLVTTKVLTPYQVLRARVLDSDHPVFSEFRCGLWRDANARYKSNPPDFGDATRNLNVMPQIFEEIMSIDGSPIKGDADDVLIMMPNADEASVAALKTSVSAGSLMQGSCETDGYCPGDVDVLGTRLEQRMQTQLSGSTRDALRAMRQDRICHVLETVAGAEGDDRFPNGSGRFPNLPSLPEVTCP